MTDENVVLFHHSCYYRLEQTKATIDTYWTVRTHAPEFFSARDPKSNVVQKALNLQRVVIYPGTTPEGYKVISTQLIDFDPSNYSFNESFKAYMLTSDIWQLEEGTCNGVLMLVDMEGMAFGHMAKFSLPGFRKFFYYLQEAMPIRLKGLHFINVVPFMDKIMAMIKPFMKKELMEMLHLHTESIDSLYKFIPQNMLPCNYPSGKNQTFKLEDLHAEYKKKIADNRDWILNEETWRVNENLRPGKAKSAGDLFGMEGSFKKLEID